MDVGFYHLTSSTLEQALPKLLAKSLERGWNVVVQSGEGAAMKALDDHLWKFEQTAFLPHGCDDPEGEPEPHTERQPIWLTVGDDTPNAAKARFFVHSASPDESTPLGDYDRVVIMFDGADDAEVRKARETWKWMRGVGHSLTYWQQTDAGGWTKAQEA
ncbi:MAG: DNA polymerase III subunit chi [Pseudomonadota bacterium]